ncbi:MAG: cystathionine gamma-synthase, partial [Propionibacteriaceae bacterium]|nr:cystathionine gamma-synthase [Propionibacteriaceae bacterium]
MPTSTTMQGLTTGLCSDHDHSSVIPPAFLFSNYFYDTSGECPPFDYGRGGNPTR